MDDLLIDYNGKLTEEEAKQAENLSKYLWINSFKDDLKSLDRESMHPVQYEAHKQALMSIIIELENSYE